jgi:hypothetical protein
MHVMQQLACAIVVAGLTGCDGGTDPDEPIVVAEGQLLGELEGRRRYELSAVTLRLVVANRIPRSPASGR